jgi:TRAP-type C4-dicarboxylate transport system permease small subunit
MTRFLERLSHGINLWVENTVCLMGITMAVIVAVQVFSRYVLNHSLFWSEELARFLLVFLTFLGASVAYYHAAHPGVDALYRHLPRALKKGADIVVHLASISLFVLMILYGTRFAWFVKLQITPALSIPKWIILGVVPLSGVIFMIHGVTFLFKALASPPSEQKNP